MLIQPYQAHTVFFFFFFSAYPYRGRHSGDNRTKDIWQMPQPTGSRKPSQAFLLGCNFEGPVKLHC